MTDARTLIETSGLAVQCIQVPENPDMPNADETMVHWLCEITSPAGGTVQTYFSATQDRLTAGHPLPEDVLEAVILDVKSTASSSLTDWLDEIGIEVTAPEASRWIDAFDRCRQLGDEIKDELGLEIGSDGVSAPAPEQPGSPP